MRKVKVIATLGNSTENLLEDIVCGGADAVLIDNYFGEQEQNIERIEKIKELREKHNKNVAIIFDLDHIYAESKYKLIRIEEENIHFACKHDVDFIACPFVSNLNEIKKVKDILKAQNKENIALIVKIDCKEAYENIDEIIEFADCIMINRDELGMDLPQEDLPSVQKEIIYKANHQSKEVILTTQMLHSMIYNPRPTRAEVSDVANAIIDGVDAIMLIEETATGNYAKEALETVNRIITYIENQEFALKNSQNFKNHKMDIAHAIAVSIKHLIDTVDMKNIITYTKSGKTAKFIARYRPKVPVLAVVPNSKKAHSLAITRGVVTYVEPRTLTTEEMLDLAASFSQKAGLADKGDYILVTAGQPDLGKKDVPPTDFINIKKV